MGKNVTRLYEQFQPEHYDLSLEPDREALTFRGRVTIIGKKTGRPSQRLTFHQKGLTVTEATIVKRDKKGEHAIVVDRINLQQSYDEVRLHATEMLYPGSYEVTLKFSGLISRQMNGIYPCNFELKGVKQSLIATQFESHHAREAFPCIDEPEAKAIFDLELLTPLHETVLANTPVKHQKTRGGKLWSSFEPTPKMSTYLLAFIYGELSFAEGKTKDGVIVRAYATPEHVKHADFAVDCAVKTLEFYNDYFDIPYPLAKCDLVALPDFASGAMENWGLITFREQALLVDPKNTSLHLKQYVANVVAHELTHQWFGNLVTMRWWNDLWLNESFASWMSYLAVDHLFPNWKVWTQFIIDEQGLALKQDALENTHPIEVEVHHPDEIRTIFDAISYEKGASVLLMLHDYLGGEDFRDGLRLYLKRHAYGNTNTVDLWAALEEVSKRPVKQFMSAWTSQSGYPIIHATLTGPKPTLRQERFYLNPAAKKEATSWPIPLLPNHPLGIETLEAEQQEVPATTITGSTVLNQGRDSFFRTVYDSHHLERLATAVADGQLHEVARLAVLSDAFEAAKAGYGSTVDVLKLLHAYGDEDSSVVWDVIGSGIGSIRVVMDDDQIRDGLRPFIRELTAKQLARLGWEEKDGDGHFDLLLRPTILGLSSFAEEPTVVAEAKHRFHSMKKPEDVHPDLRGVVYGTIARLGDATDFDKLLAMHNASKNSEERVTLAGAMTGFHQKELIHRALAMITSDEVRLQDAAYWVAYSFMNRHARQITWEWLTSHWEWLHANIGTDLSFFRMPVYAGQSFSDAAFLPEFSAFFNSHMSPAFERPVKQAIETIEWQAAWKKRDLKPLQKYFKI